MRNYVNGDIKIDGRNIPYSIVTARDYLIAKNIIKEDEYEDWQEDNFEVYELLTQIMALKQSCFLLRHVSYSCGSLSDNLYLLKNRLIRELQENFSFEFDDEFVENYLV